MAVDARAMAGMSGTVNDSGLSKPFTMITLPGNIPE
jgi:hypothetical protein